MSGIFWSVAVSLFGFPGGSDGKASACNAEGLGSIPGSGRSPGRKWQPTPVLLPGKFHGQRSLVGYSPWGRKESATTEQLHFSIIVQILSIFVVQLLNHVWLFVTPWTAACKASLFLTMSWNLPKFMSIESGMLSTISSSATLFFFEHLNICLLFCDPWVIWKVLLFSKCMGILAYTFIIDFSSEGLWAEGTDVDYHVTSYCLQGPSGGPSALPVWAMFPLHCVCGPFYIQRSLFSWWHL